MNYSVNSFVYSEFPCGVRHHWSGFSIEESLPWFSTFTELQCTLLYCFTITMIEFGN